LTGFFWPDAGAGVDYCGLGPEADDAVIPNSTTAETNSNGFNIAASSVADEDYRHLATE
jgi:hypothetical protein